MPIKIVTLCKPRSVQRQFESWERGVNSFENAPKICSVLHVKTIQVLFIA